MFRALLLAYAICVVSALLIMKASGCKPPRYTQEEKVLFCADRPVLDTLEMPANCIGRLTEDVTAKVIIFNEDGSDPRIVGMVIPKWTWLVEGNLEKK